MLKDDKKDYGNSDADFLAGVSDQESGIGSLQNRQISTRCSIEQILSMDRPVWLKFIRALLVLRSLDISLVSSSEEAIAELRVLSAQGHSKATQLLSIILSNT